MVMSQFDRGHPQVSDSSIEVPVADVRTTEEKIRGAEREVAFHFYPGMKHWFVEENRPVEYNRDASGLAWKRTLEFFESRLR